MSVIQRACGGYPPSLRSAAIILLRLTDYPKAATVASDLIKLQPFNDSGYYLRAVAYDRGGFPKKAIDDYITTIELFGNKEKIGSASYYGDGAKLREAGPILRCRTAYRNVGGIESRA